MVETPRSVLPQQRASSPPGVSPPRRAPGGPARLGTPRLRLSHRGAQPPPQLLERAASKVADFTAFDLRPLTVQVLGPTKLCGGAAAPAPAPAAAAAAAPAVEKKEKAPKAEKARL